MIRLAIRISIVSAFAAMSVGCITDWADGEPQKTVDELVFKYTDGHISDAMTVARTALTFNEYCKAATEKERLEAHDRYFYDARIDFREEMSYAEIIRAGSPRIRIEINGKNLDEEGAKWLVYMQDDERALLLGEFANEGGLQGKLTPQGPFEAESVWNLTSEFTARDYFIGLTGSGTLIWTEEGTALSMKYRTAKPVVFEEGEECASEGAYAAEVENAHGEIEGIEVEYDGPDDIWITYDGSRIHHSRRWYSIW